MSMKFDSKFDWKIYSWLKRGSRRIKILKYLYNTTEPASATQIKKIQKIDITQSAFTLNELWTAKLANCLNPKDHHGKLFIITKKGKDMIKKLKASKFIK